MADAGQIFGSGMSKRDGKFDFRAEYTDRHGELKRIC